MLKCKCWKVHKDLYFQDTFFTIATCSKAFFRRLRTEKGRTDQSSFERRMLTFHPVLFKPDEPKYI